MTTQIDLEKELAMLHHVSKKIGLDKQLRLFAVFCARLVQRHLPRSEQDKLERIIGVAERIAYRDATPKDVYSLSMDLFADERVSCKDPSRTYRVRGFYYSTKYDRIAVDCATALCEKYASVSAYLMCRIAIKKEYCVCDELDYGWIDDVLVEEYLRLFKGLV